MGLLCSIAPNSLELLGSDLVKRSKVSTTPTKSYDVCVSLSSATPVSHGSSCACRVEQLIDLLRSAELTVFVHDGAAEGDREVELAAVMQGVKVLVACISNVYATNHACSRLFQYAKKTLERTAGLVIIPCIFEPSGFVNWAFQQTVVGLLIAGELYVDFSSSENFGAKSEEMLLAMRDHVNVKAPVDSAVMDRAPSATADAETDVFISYCWVNSTHAFEQKQVSNLSGGPYSDPRRLKAEICDLGYSAWLDIERLQSGNTKGAGMFEQLSLGLINTKCVVAFISDEYARSPNCRMEFQFAFKSIAKPVIVCIVGAPHNNEWQASVVGMLAGTISDHPIDLRLASTEQRFVDLFGGVRSRLDEILGSLKRTGSVTASRRCSIPKPIRPGYPQIADRVLSHWKNWEFYPATIHAWDPKTLEYTVDFADGDQSNRVQSYELVALDVRPADDEVHASPLSADRSQIRSDQISPKGADYVVAQIMLHRR